jgi:type IV secretion system protein VirB4
MNSFLAPVAFVNDSAVLTKSGDVFSVLRLAGKDPECMEEAEIADIVQRFTAAMRTLGPEYRVYQYLMKQHSPDLGECPIHDGIERRRFEFLEGRARSLYSVRLYLVVMRMRQLTDTGIVAGILNRLSVRGELRIAAVDLRRQTEALGVAVASLRVQLRETVDPAILDRRGVLGFLRSLVNCTGWKADVSGPVDDADVDRQMAQSDMECWRTHLQQDEFRIKVLSLVELPSQTFPHMLRGLLSLPGNAILCSQWKREPNRVTRKEIDQKRRHYHLGKSSLLSYFGNSNPRPDEVLIDDSKAAVVEALNGALTEMEMNENYFGRYSLTITLYDEDQAVLNRTAAKAAEVFATHDARLIDETYNLLYAWLSQVPGNYAHAHRWLWVLNTNYADMSFLFAPVTGEQWNQHLRAPALNIVESDGATPYFLNLHYQDVGHTLVLGAIGSGKSFLTNFLTASYQKYLPYTLIFDLGGSYRALTAHYCGSYQHVGKENSFTINPCALPLTAENQEFLFRFVRVLIERDGYSMTAEEREDLTRSIADLYELDPPQRRLATLARTCKRSYRNRLAEWAGDGRLARYFDNEADTLSLARFQAFDFESMDQADVLEAMLFYILHRANHVIYSPAENDTPKFVVFDEAWRFFRHPVTRDAIHEGLKTWRKRNAVMLLATQSGDDMARSQLLPVIAESAFTRFFLANPGMDPAYYRETFHLNSVEADHIMRLQPKRQFLLKRPDGAKVLNLNVDEQALRLFSIRNTEVQ